MENQYGSVINDDNNSSNNNDNTSIKQYMSMLNYEMNIILKQTKTNIDVIEFDSNSTITDNLKVIHEKLKRLNKNNITTKSGDDEIMNMLKLIKTQVDLTLHN